MKNTILLLLLTFGILASAQEKKSKNAKYSIEVNGNCEQCKKRIEKAAYGVAGIKSANWNLETHRLDLILNEEKATLSDVKKAIVKIGHDADDMKSSDEDYEKLHSCCKYERK